MIRLTGVVADSSMVKTVLNVATVPRRPEKLRRSRLGRSERSRVRFWVFLMVAFRSSAKKTPAFMRREVKMCSEDVMMSIDN